MTPLPPPLLNLPKTKTRGRARARGRVKARVRANSRETRLINQSGGIGHIPSSTGVRFNFARHGTCDTDNCAFQHVSAGQLRKALGGGGARPGDGSSTDKQSAKNVDRGQSQGAGSTKSKGKGQAKGKSDAATSKEGDGKYDMKASPAAVRSAAAAKSDSRGKSRGKQPKKDN